jgi:hypothetical protein
VKRLRGQDLNLRPSGYEPAEGLRVKTWFLANFITNNVVQDEQLVHHVRRLVIIKHDFWA